MPRTASAPRANSARSRYCCRVQTMEETARVVASPCIGVCTLDPHRRCTGCGRHIDEIARWPSMSNDERSRMEDCGLRVGEPVLCTKNLWDMGVQNGSLGRLHAIEEPPLVDLEGNVTYGWIRWDDGELRPLTFEVLDAIELGYAVTVHKAQGSQFRRVIVPVSKARNLDRTMLYTAITRATHQVLMVGDRAAASRAARELPHSSQRRVGLRALVTEALAAH